MFLFVLHNLTMSVRIVLVYARQIEISGLLIKKKKIINKITTKLLRNNYLPQKTKQKKKKH